MNTEEKSDYERGLIKNRRTFSLVWLVPIVAVLITVGMIWKSYMSEGTRIYITIENGNGIMDGKTPLMYKGINIGTVEDVRIKEDDVSKLLLTVVVDKESASSVTRKGNKFWKVEPKVSLTEISGLDTLIKGVYIAVMPAATSREALEALPKEKHFVALESPPVDVFKPGLSILVNTVDKGEIAIGAPVLYNKQVIGKVEAKDLSSDKKSINIHLRIDEKYMELIHENSLFYKFNAIDIKASFSGIKVKMGSFASFIAGGIAIRNTQESLNSPLVKEERLFMLFNDETSTYLSEDEIVLKMDKTYNLTSEISKVYCKGVEAGIVSDMHYDALKDKTTVKIKLFKDFRALANTAAYFWIVRPILSFDKVEGLDTAIRGNYINFISVDPRAKKASLFTLHEEKPHVQGTHIKLSTADIGSLSKGAGLFYHNIEIGLVHNYTLNADKKTFTVDMIVFPKFRNLLNKSSLFYHKSGIEFQADLNGISVHTGSLETIVRGGIAVLTPDFKAEKKLKRSYKLYESHKEVTKAQYLAEDGVHLTLNASSMGSLKVGSAIFFKQIKVGEVLSYKWDANKSVINFNVFIIAEYANEVQEDTIFYNASGIRAKIDLNGLKIDAESIETIVAGGIAFYTPASTQTKRVRNRSRFKLYDNKEDAMDNFFDIVLISDDSLGLEVGSPLKYKHVTLGQVEEISLREKRVYFNLRLETKYKDFINKNTAFWLERFQVSLSGVKNAASVLKGPFIVIKPGDSNKSSEAYFLMPKPPIPHLHEKGLRVIVKANRLGGLKAEAPVYYRQIKIGSVIQHRLSSDATSVGIEIFIEPCFAHLIRDNSYFYNTSGIGMEINLLGAKVKTESIESILSGGIGVLTPDEYEEASEDGHIFNLHEDFDEKALAWSPKLQSSNAMCE